MMTEPPKVGEKWEVEFGVINQTSAIVEVLSEIRQGRYTPVIQCKIGEEISDVSVLCFKRKIE